MNARMRRAGATKPITTRWTTAFATASMPGAGSTNAAR